MADRTDRMARLDPPEQAMKRATRALIAAAGGQERAADYCRRIKRHQTFSDYGARNVDQFMPADVIAELEEVTVGLPGWPHVIPRELCARAGGAFVAAPAGRPGSGDWLQRIAVLTKEHADVAGGLMTALADGHLSGREVRDGDLVAEADQLFAIAAEIAVLLRRIEAEG